MSRRSIMYVVKAVIDNCIIDNSLSNSSGLVLMKSTDTTFCPTINNNAVDIVAHKMTASTAEIEGQITATGGIKLAENCYLKAEANGIMNMGQTYGGNNIILSIGEIRVGNSYDENNDIKNMITVSRRVTGGNGSNGVGSGIAFSIENNAGNMTSAGSISYSFEDATAGDENVKVNISGKVKGSVVDLLTFSGGKWLFFGGLNQVNVTNVEIEDKIITLNKGGLANSGNNSGIEIEEDGSITGFIKTDNTSEFYDILTPKASKETGYVSSLRFYGLNDDGENSTTIPFGGLVYSLHDTTVNHEYTDLVLEGYIDGSGRPLMLIETGKDVPFVTFGAYNDNVSPKLVKKIQVTYTDTTATCDIPINAIILNLYLQVTTEFDDTGTDLIDIGISGSGERYAADVDVSTTGWKTLNLSNIPDQYSSNTTITMTYTGQNEDATQGVAKLYIEYISGI